MLTTILAYTGYYVGIGVEALIIVVAAVLLILMLTGVMFKKKEQADRVEVVLLNEDGEEPAEEEEYEEEPLDELEEPAEEEAAEVAEEVQEEPQPEPEAVQEAAATADEQFAADPEIVYLQGDGIVFNDSKSITELYEELSNEQKSFFDELREEALQKPDAELSISKNFITVKIGKRNLIKLLIKRGVTVAEFMLENEALKQFRINNKNKKGKSHIKVKPTVVQVLDLPSLKVAVDMINLAYEELMMED